MLPAGDHQPAAEPDRRCGQHGEFRGRRHKSNISDLAKWAKPMLVVSSQTAPTSVRESVKMYEKLGATFLATWPNGAITLRPDDREAPVETYRTKRRLKV